MSFFVFVPAAVTYVGTAAAGVFIGSAAAATLSAAAVTAIGAGVISGTITAVRGGDVGDVLKSAVIGGVSSYAGASIGNFVGTKVATVAFQAGAGAASSSIGYVAGQAAAGATRAAISGGDVKQAALSGALSSTVDSIFRNVLPPEIGKNQYIRDGVSAAVSAKASGQKVSDAACGSGFSSGSTVGN